MPSHLSTPKRLVCCYFCAGDDISSSRRTARQDQGHEAMRSRKPVKSATAVDNHMELTELKCCRSFLEEFQRNIRSSSSGLRLGCSKRFPGVNRQLPYRGEDVIAQHIGFHTRSCFELVILLKKFTDERARKTGSPLWNCRRLGLFPEHYYEQYLPW